MNQTYWERLVKNFSNLWKENSWKNTFILLLPLIIMGTYYPITLLRSYNNFHFIVLCAFILIYILSSSRSNFHFDKLDISWAGFLCLIFLSTFFAINPAISLMGFFGWLLMYIYYKVIKSIQLSSITQNALQKLFIVFFLATLLNACIVVLMNLGHVFTINGLHKNIFSFYLVAVFPFLLFYNKSTKWWTYVKYGITISLIILLLILSARNALLMLFITLFFYLYTEKSFRINKRTIIIASSALSLLLIMLIIPQTRESLINLSIVQEFYEPNEMDRYYMYRNSIWLFMDAPFTGVGLDNWRYLAYQKGFEDFFAAENILAFRNQDVHSVYAKLLAEIGVFGLIFYLINLFVPTIKNLSSLQNSSSFKKACIANLIVFIVGSAIFQLTIFRPWFFSPVMLIAFFSLSFISRNQNASENTQYDFSKILLTILSLICMIYFIHYFIGEQNMKKLETLKDDPASYFEHFDEAHNSKLKTHLNGKAILPEIAEYASTNDSLQRAKIYYNRAIELDPYNVDLLNQSAQFHLDKLNDISNAEELAKKSLSIHQNYVITKYILAHIEYQKGNFDKALSCLSYYDELNDRIQKAKTKATDLPSREKRLQKRRYEKHRVLLTNSRKLRNKIQRQLNNENLKDPAMEE